MKAETKADKTVGDWVETMVPSTAGYLVAMTVDQMVVKSDHMSVEMKAAL